MHSWSLPVVLVLAAIVLLYLRGWRNLHLAFPGVLRPWRPVAFVAGMLVLLAASGSPLAMLDHHYLTAHMAQHLLLMTVAVPLILLGAPVITLLHGFPPGISGQFHQPAIERFASMLTHPVFCWLACTAVVIGWHIPAVFQLGMRSELSHAVEHFCFFAAGILFWWPVIQPWPAVAKWPSWSIPVYLFLAALPCDALSAFLCLCNRVVYTHYLPAQQSLQIAALKDQACAGALMWVWVTFAYLFPAAALTFRLLSPEKRFVEKQVV
jgi:cytochrome c oxidase assembly factor CtaG